MRIAIIGAGAWGTSVALSSFRAGHEVTLITKCERDAIEINTDHENLTFFPGIRIPEEITVTHKYDALTTCEVLFLICPSAAIDDVCQHVKAIGFSEKTPILSFCKGLPGDHWELPSMYIERNFPRNRFGVLSGPSYAKEVALGYPTRLVLASKDFCCRGLPLSFQNMALLYSDDVVGVELGGCLKNIYAIGAGMLDGLKLGDNAKCAYLTMCLEEMMNLGKALGAKRETFLLPSGIGDLLATCSGSWSRNRTFGETLTQHNNPQEVFDQSVAAIEGYRSTKTFHHIFKENAIQAPIVNVLYDILYSGKYDSRQSIEELLRKAIF